MTGSYSHAESARAFEPFDAYATLREHSPLHAEAGHDPPYHVLSRFRDVVDVLKQPAVWGNRDGPGVFYQEAGVLGSTDDPDHARHRRVLRSAFLPTAIARLEPRVAAIADELFDAIVPQGEGDFVELYAFPFPAIVIGELLGVRAEDRDDFRRWSLMAVDALTGGDVDAYDKAKHAIADCIEIEVDARLAAATPGDDVSSLLAVALRDGVISRAEMRHLGYQLLVAGHETTTSLIGLMLYRLIEHPDVMARLRADPGLVPHAVEEALRFDSPVQGLFRTNGSECTIAGAHARPAEQAAAAVRFGQQGSAAVRGPRCVLPRPRGQRAASPRRLRVGHPLLHRCPARPIGGTAHVRAHPHADGRHRAGGSSATQRLVRAPRVDQSPAPLEASTLITMEERRDHA